MEASDSEELEKVLPLVAVESVVDHQPFGFSKIALVNLRQSANAFLPMLDTLAEIVTLFNSWQL